MSFTEVKILNENTHLLNNRSHGSSLSQKLTGFTSWVGKSFLTTLSILSAVIVIIVLVAVLPGPSSYTGSQNSVLKQSNVAESGENDLTVESNLGKVQGRTLISRDGRNYYAFYKIPYAEPPVGRLRFKNPKPAKKWDGVLSEPEGPPPCIQPEDMTASIRKPKGSEDCLYLNVHTPKFPDKENSNQTLLPVIVYIFGGAFFSGDCNKYSPEYLMDEDVIFVVFQHRIGAFGFLNTEDGEIPGNLGFKDQVMVLKWVKENIEAFGGDPNKVTLLGSSSGSVSVSNHMISPMSEGLFHRAIGLSGVSLVPTLLIKNPLKIVEYLGEQLNCSTKSTRRLVRCLRDVDAGALVVVDVPADRFPSAFALTVEYIEDPNDLSEIFMPDLPYNLLKTGKVNKIPYILGNTESEQLKSTFDVLKSPELVDALNKNWTQLAPSQFKWKGSALDPDTISSKIRDFYFGKGLIGNDTWRNLTDLISDHTYIHPTFIAANWHAIHSPENVYLYFFTKEVPKSYADKKKVGFPKRDYGPSHGDELQFMYHYVDDRFPIIEVGSENYNFSKRFIKMWVDFVETGNASAPGVVWDPINPEESKINWLRIDDTLEMTDRILPRMKFWNQFSPEDLYYA